MANFLSELSLIQDKSDLNYINYDSLRQDFKEFMLSNLWDFTWTKPCNAVYFPGDAFCKARLRGVTLSFNHDLTAAGDVTIRNYNVYQSVSSGNKSGTFTLEFTEFEDQAISAWLHDWREKLGNIANYYIFRKEDTSAEAKLTIFNTSRTKIRTYLFRGVQIQDNGDWYNPQMTSEDPSANNEISATFHYEYGEIKFENI